MALSEQALAMKQAGESEGDPEYLGRQTDTPGESRVAAPSDHNPPMGALDAEGHRPVLERSRKVR
ncbi:hypothetical protein [Blastomonas sp.]|uniref:hypothetical protein n=1 Tax=Blastomonas sp. TaxID=1909299 RepID=UPI0035948F93